MAGSMAAGIPATLIHQMLSAGSITDCRLVLAKWIDGIVAADRAAYVLQVGDELRQYLLRNGVVAEVRPAIALNGSVTGRTITERQSFRIDDTREFAGADLADLAAAGLRSSAHVPIVHDDQGYAALVVAHHRPSAYSSQDLAALEAVAALLDAAQRLHGLIPVVAEPGNDRGALAARLGATDARKSNDQRSLLRAALRQGDIESHFQAVFGYPGHQILSLEALARWRQSGGVAAAGQFLPNARGLSERVTLDVARRTVDLGQHLAQRDVTVPPIAINVRGSELDAMINWWDVERPARANVFFEVPATDAAADYEALRTRMLSASKRGLKFVLDDVLEPPTELFDLFRLPLAGVKLGLALSHTAVGNDEVTSRISQIVAAAQRRGLHVTAKGVETSEQAELLSGLGIRRMQGYFFLPPLDEPSVLSWLAPEPERSTRRVKTSN